jgi:cytochrome b6
VTLFLFILQFITGMALALYYVPTAGEAHKSVIDIVTKLHMGWFFRSLHHWGAQLALLALFVHLFTTLLQKSYRKPRELTWVSGFLLLGMAIFFGLSGYFLLWDERAFAAVRVATGGAGSLPLAGGLIKAFLRGGIDVTGETLTRFYAFHVSILPMATLLVIAFHLLLVQAHGMSTPLSLEGKNLRQVPFFPNAFLRDLMVWLVVLGAAVTLATLAPPGIGRRPTRSRPHPRTSSPNGTFSSSSRRLSSSPATWPG